MKIGKYSNIVNIYKKMHNRISKIENKLNSSQSSQNVQLNYSFKLILNSNEIPKIYY